MVAAAVLLGILAAGESLATIYHGIVTGVTPVVFCSAGVIGNQEAQPVKEARDFGGSHKSSDTDIKSAGVVFGGPTRKTSTTEKQDSSTRAYTPGPSSTTVSTHLPRTDTSMIEGKLCLVELHNISLPVRRIPT